MRAKITSLSLNSATNLAVMAPIKSTMIDGPETMTHEERLRRFLNALNAVRRMTRESDLDTPIFPDVIGRFGVIQQFRYAIWPAKAPRKKAYLSLNVSFDGGWEPYMRVIYKDIGPLLDALFCHCDGYPTTAVSFDEYCRWVRSNELGEGSYYTDFAATAADARYHAKVEQACLSAGTNPSAAIEAVAQAALTPLNRQLGDARVRALDCLSKSLPLPLRTARGLLRLAPLFGPKPDNSPKPMGDDTVLLHFAQLALKDFLDLLAMVFKRKTWNDEGRGAEAVQPDRRLEPLLTEVLPKLQDYLAEFHDELSWLTGERKGAASNRESRTPQPAGVKGPLAESEPKFPGPVHGPLQHGILGTTDSTHGCVVLLRISDAAEAAKFLEEVADRPAGPIADGSDVRWQVAFTMSGLRKLGIDEARLDVFAPEFAEGMEARSGILGDARSNHPNHWRRPLRWSRKDMAPIRDERIDMSAVHLVIILRTRAASADCTPGDILPLLRNEIQEKFEGNGCAVLAVEALQSRRDPADATRSGPNDLGSSTTSVSLY